MDTKFVSIYGLNGTKQLIINYHKPSNLPMLFNVEPYQRKEYAVTTSPSIERICLSVHDEVKQNLLATQKEILFIQHWYGHENMQWFQSLMRGWGYNSNSGEGKELPVLHTKKRWARCCESPLCAAYQLGETKTQGVDYQTSKPVLAHTYLLKQDHLAPGISSIPISLAN